MNILINLVILCFHTKSKESYKYKSIFTIECDIIPRTNILKNEKYGIFIKCIVNDIKTSTEIHKVYRSQFSKDKRIKYNAITNILSKLTLHPYKFFNRTQVGRNVYYDFNYPYWFEFIYKKFFKQKSYYPNFDDNILLDDLKEYIYNNINNPVPIIEFIYRYIIFTGNKEYNNPFEYLLNKQKLPLKSQELLLDKKYTELHTFRLDCVTYFQTRLLHLYDTEIDKILKS